MNPTNFLFFLPLLFTNFALAQTREFTDQKGRKITAELVSSSGTHVKIKRADGQTFDLPITHFSADDQTYIKNWLTINPDAIDYRFRFIIKKKEGSKSKLRESSISKSSQMNVTYEIYMENNTAGTINEIEIQYNIFVQNKVGSTGFYYYDYGGEIGKLGIINGTKKVNSITGKGKVEFDTKSASLQTYLRKYNSSGKDHYRDQLLGIWVRVIKNGKIIAEHKKQEQPGILEHLSFQKKPDKQKK